MANQQQVSPGSRKRQEGPIRPLGAVMATVILHQNTEDADLSEETDKMDDPLIIDAQITARVRVIDENDYYQTTFGEILERTSFRVRRPDTYKLSEPLEKVSISSAAPSDTEGQWRYRFFKGNQLVFVLKK